MRKIRLRTKFLLSLLVVSAGLTSGTLFVVRYAVQNRIRDSLREDVRTSVNTYERFDRDRDANESRAVELIANLPNLRALMTTRDPITIQDASGDVWRLSGSDIMVLADPAGKLDALRAATNDLAPEQAGKLLHGSLEKGNSRDWWVDGNRLYQVWIHPIYFGTTPDSAVLGYLAVGHEINEKSAREFSSVASSEVAFESGSSIVASTLMPNTEAELLNGLSGQVIHKSGFEQEIHIGKERYLVSTIPLSGEGNPPISLSVLKSFDKATAFLSELNHILVALGLLSIVAGSILVFLISDTFTRPLTSLVAGVRALEQGDYAFPLEISSGDEVAEVTTAFDRMRTTLQHTQTEQRQLEERLRQAHKMEAVGRLAGGVAHDFNNLLTVISGHSDLLLEREGADDFLKRSVGQIQKAAGRAVSMTRQLLAFSRMQVLQMRVFDVNAVMVDMGKMLPRLIGEHIEYTFIPGTDLRAIKGDPGQLEQVIMNLAVNARDAMPDGGTLKIATRNIHMDPSRAAQHAPMLPGKYVLLSVADTGHGMDEETKKHIFEPFFTTKEVGKGTGLGLATVYGVVKQSGGFIWVDSAVGKGTTFEIYMPQAAGAAGPDDAQEPQAQPAGGSETILVVEDEEAVRDLASQFLKACGYHVLEAKNGLEALSVAETFRGQIHLLLSDIVMPVMGGKVLAAKLVKLRPDVKVLLMTGYAEFSSAAANNSVDTPCIQKPFSRQSLTARVRETLEGTVAEQASVSANSRIP